jgi:hypothetical protein
MDNPNARQHGGEHYKKNEYQHWDFVCDTRIHYLLGCATKYVSRWRDKGMGLDLEKAVHYLEKAMARGICVHDHKKEYVDRFCDQLGQWEAKVVRIIMSGRFEDAIGELDYVLEANFRD